MHINTETNTLEMTTPKTGIPFELSCIKTVGNNLSLAIANGNCP